MIFGVTMELKLKSKSEPMKPFFAVLLFFRVAAGGRRPPATPAVAGSRPDPAVRRSSAAGSPGKFGQSWPCPWLVYVCSCPL